MISAQPNDTVNQAIKIRFDVIIDTAQIIVKDNHNKVFINSYHQLNLFSLRDNTNTIDFHKAIANKNTVKNILISAVVKLFSDTIVAACKHPNNTLHIINNIPIHIDIIPSAHKYLR